MGKSLDWVREEATGRLIFRRRYPDDVRPFLAKPGCRELKVPLGSKTYITPEAFQRYEQAKRRFDREVREARAARKRHEKDQEGRLDSYTPDTIAHLVELFVHDWHVYEEASLRAKGEAWAELVKSGWDELLGEFREWRLAANIEAMEKRWGKDADALLSAEGLLVDPSDHEGRSRFLYALNDAAIEFHESSEARTAGMVVKVPPRPKRPMNPKGRARTVSALLDAYKAAKWDGWSVSSRKAISPVMRLLRETIGDRDAASIDRAAAREVFELVKSLPMSIGKRAEFKGLTVPEAIAEGRRLGSPTIGPNTVNKGYMVQMSAIFNWAADEKWATKNPFSGLSVDDPVEDRDRREPFTMPQLQKLFSAEPWTSRQADAAEKPGGYWVPLIALYSGMRLGEITGLRIMDVADLEGFPTFMLRPHEGRRLKNKESRRNVPLHSELVRLGFLSFLTHRRDIGRPEDLLFPDGKASSRGQSGAKLGERFSLLLKEREIVGTKLGMHSFRHNFEDALRLIGYFGRPEGQALAGRKIAGSEGNYGSGFTVSTLRGVLEKVRYPELDLTHLQP
ncbi:site-specific integrase [Sphingobium sp. SA916]|uniref:site-specific integrase n=1 Tax=Sphingobium sp. SA916 TaxID=1851207 RepID=UPI000C9FCA21|nr:site-specific integrase [Sphingobium sp. SA916]PNQ03630.1 hypothetical protein A8G00_10380 [Sphingobium sp. SA916]